MEQPGRQSLTVGEGGLSQDLIAQREAGIREEPIDNGHWIEEVGGIRVWEGDGNDQKSQC